jgi:folate-binding protein YgfZ
VIADMQDKGRTLTPTPLEYLAAARFSGPDAAAFLQSQLSADIEALEPGDCTFAAYCSPRGQVIALLLVCRDGDSYRVAGSSCLLPGVLERLRIYVFRSRVEFELEPGGSVLGIEAGSERAFTPAASGLAYSFADASPSRPEDLNTWKQRELRQNVAWLQSETSEKFIPQMLGYDEIGAVSFSKGCYPGQEIVARARYLGKVKRKPLKLILEETPELAPGSAVELLRAEKWTRAALVDFAPDGSGGALLFLVAAEDPGAPATLLRQGDKDYRCATI